jgi:uncharacterized protein (TIGR02145 family)
MGENLNYKADSSWCYNNKESNCKKYGRLYDWNTAVDICPAGWHLPNRDEWKDLGRVVAGWGDGCKLMSKTQKNGSDDYGWSGLAGGERKSGDDFSDIGESGYWWVAAGRENRHMHYMHIDGISEASSVWGYAKNGCSDPVNKQGCVNNNYGISVRCVKDSVIDVKYVMKSELSKYKIIFSTENLDSAALISSDKYPLKVIDYEGKIVDNEDDLIKLPGYKEFEIFISIFYGGDTDPHSLSVVKSGVIIDGLNVTPHWGEPGNFNVYEHKTFKIYEDYTIEIYAEEQNYTQERDDKGEPKYSMPLKYTKYYRINDNGDFYEVILK